MSNDFFDQFPVVRYSFDPTSNTQITITNFFIRVKIKEMLMNNSYVFYDYTVKDDEKPEDIAFRYYGDSRYHWVVYLSNNIIDPIYDWVLPYDAFIDYIEANFGTVGTAQTTIHAYLDSYGNEIDITTYISLPSNERSTIMEYDYWLQQNETKRNIQLLSKDFLSQVESDLQQILQDAVSAS